MRERHTRESCFPGWGQPDAAAAAAVHRAGSVLQTCRGDAPAGKQLVHQLGLITMDAGGRTSAHSHGGSEVLYVIKGTVELALNNGTRTNVSAGQGASIRPGLIMQLHVVGSEAVRILTYFVTPEGEPWQTNVQTIP